MPYHPIKMAIRKKEISIDSSAEEKILNAARIIFQQKGYAATRTRDIAEEAGINLALLNYYFRSKEKLFNIIMLESMQGFVGVIKNIFNSEDTSFEEKIEILINRYIDHLLKNPDLPLFILSEIRNNPEGLFQNTGMKEAIQHSHFFKQYAEEIASGKIAPLHPMHFMMNVMGMTVFPFIAKPMLQRLGELSDEQYASFMEERKKMIPIWIKLILSKS